MATDNETVAEIVREMREWRGGGTVKVFMVEMADRIEAAHDREIAAKDGERKGLLKANESLANDNTRLRGEIAELRECLQEAVDYQCGRGEKCEGCFYCEVDNRKECIAYKWRKALEGANDESK